MTKIVEQIKKLMGSPRNYGMFRASTATKAVTRPPMTISNPGIASECSFVLVSLENWQGELSTLLLDLTLSVHLRVVLAIF